VASSTGEPSPVEEFGDDPVDRASSGDRAQIGPDCLVERCAAPTILMFLCPCRTGGGTTAITGMERFIAGAFQLVETGTSDREGDGMHGIGAFMTHRTINVATDDLDSSVSTR